MGKAQAFPQENQDLRHCGVPEVLHYGVMFNFLRHCGLDPQSHSLRHSEEREQRMKASAYPFNASAGISQTESSLFNKPKAGLPRHSVPRNDSKTRALTNSVVAQPPRNDVMANEPLTLTLSRKGRGNSSPVTNLVPYYPNVLTTRKRCAFTLAEVLITLGIIGVVAAMTLPALVQNYKKRVVETRLAKFYTVMNQAIQRSEVDNGAQEFWEFPSGSSSRLDFYNKYLAKYIKTTKVVTNSDLNTQSASPIIVYFSDGSAAVYGTTWLFYPEAKNLKLKKYGENEEIVYVDTETSGRDWFTFVFNPSSRNNYYKKGLEPYVSGWNGTKESLYNHSVLGCRKQLSGTYERAYCAKLIQMNGWKIPDDYPLKF